MSIKCSSAPIYRLPPMVYGPMVSMASDGSDKIDWGLKLHGIPEIWKEGNEGEGIIVGVADTGKPRHSDLDDAIIGARNFTRSYTDEDMNGHSTHVCGTIGARKDGKGVVGVAPKCSIMTAKVLGDDGSGDNLMVASGVRWLHQQGCHIINMSLGGGFDPAIADAVKDAVDGGVIVICAAGNEGDNGGNTVGYPAKLPSTVAIASYNAAGKISQFSSRGEEVHVAFPGENILSTWPNESFRRISGTSMATPFCVGLTALLLAQQVKNGSPQINNNADLIRRLQGAAVDQGPIGTDNDWGWGIVDTDKFLTSSIAPIDDGNKPEPPVLPGRETDLFHGLIKIVWDAQYNGHTGLFIYTP